MGDRAEESEISMVNNAKRINGHLNNDLNMSGIVDMKIRLGGGSTAAAGASRTKMTSRSMTRLKSNRSMHSQKSLEALEKGWS